MIVLLSGGSDCLSGFVVLPGFYRPAKPIATRLEEIEMRRMNYIPVD
jgi:hypothetical protein